MVGRILAIAMNAYREAMRARVLFGLLAAALVTSIYAVLVATLSLRQELRVVADIGAASLSLYAVLVAIVLGATSLYRELELKTIFPILTRPLRRHEYVIGKYLGTLATLGVFLALDGATVLLLLAAMGKQSGAILGGVLCAFAVALAILLVRAKHARVFVVVPWALALLVAAALLAAPAGDERRLVIASLVLTFFEVAIVAAVATLFSSFSSPFLTAIFTFGVFQVGRSADLLANLPAKVFCDTIRGIGRALATVMPNLHIYVPPRPLLLGQVANAPLWPYVTEAGLHALSWALALLSIGALVFRKRDFQ
jgi:ABC-type transport system involved in multi-copper enzyme maturation permease subunit